MSEEREELEARIAAYIDGELPESEAARLEVYLANTNPAMAEQVIGMLGDKHKMQELPRSRAPEELLAHVMEKVERATLLNDVEHLAQPRRSWWQSRVTTAAAIFVLVGGFGVLVFRAVVHPDKDNKWPTVVAEGPKAAPTPVWPLEPGREIAAAPRALISPSKIGTDKDAAPESLASSAGATPDRHASFKAGSDGNKAADHIEPLPGKSAADAALKDRAAIDEIEVAKSDEVVQKQLAKNEQLVQNGPADASKEGYISADSAAKALSNLSVQGSMASTNPIVVTLVARDDNDPTRLRTVLERFMADPTAANRQATLQNRYTNNLFRGNTLTLNGILDNNGNAAAGNGNNPTGVNGNSDSTISNAVNPTSNPIGNSTAGNLTVNNSTLRDNYKIFNGTGQFDVNDGIASNGGNVSNVANGSKMKTQMQQQAGPGLNRAQNDFSSPYRVVLRQDQLQQLTSEFHVYSMSCGPQAYVITDSESRLAGVGGGGVAGSIAGKPAAELEKSGLSDTAHGKTARGVAATPAAAKAPAAPSPAPTTPAEALAGERKDNRESQQKASVTEYDALRQNAAATQPAASQFAEQQAEKSRWVDCVIKMEPRPNHLNLQQLTAPAAAPASQSQQPAK